MKFLPVVTAKRIFFWIRSQTKTKSLNFSTHFRLMDFIKIILWNSPNFHSCGIFQGMACISRNKIQQLWIAVFTYYILISHIFSKILHTKSYTTYQKFSNYLVSFQKIYISGFFLLLSGPIQIGTPHLETVIQGPCPVHGWCQRYNLAVRGAWWLYVAFIINFDHSNSLSGLCSYRYAFEISHQCASASADNGPY